NFNGKFNAEQVEWKLHPEQEKML
ncbi:MAG: hypothetical protein FD143_3654, partial [Ignavibacteria bacterium]